VSESIARRWLDRRDWQLAVCVVGGDSGDLFFLLLLVIVDNDSFRIAVHITLMGRRGGILLHIRILSFWGCGCAVRSVAGVLGLRWRGGS